MSVKSQRKRKQGVNVSRTTVTIPTKLHEQAKRLAVAERRSLANLVVLALEEYIAQYEDAA